MNNHVLHHDDNLPTRLLYNYAKFECGPNFLARGLLYLSPTRKMIKNEEKDTKKKLFAFIVRIVSFFIRKLIKSSYPLSANFICIQ